MVTGSGKFVISLDFELMWGVRDVVTKQTYGEHIKGVHKAIPELLKYFTKYNISATFAAVGFLFFKDKEELVNNLPLIKPCYSDTNLSPYGQYIENIGQNYSEDPYHFGSHLIDLIKNTPNQEIGTHTFSHFYCLEPGQTANEFNADIAAAIAIAKKRGISISSIIFPRNQVNSDYLKICVDNGIMVYRSNENSWIYKERTGQQESIVRRGFRLLDSYINLSGHHCYNSSHMKAGLVINLPSSRFLRPYSKKHSFFEGLRLGRIKRSMTYAAKNNLLYHLWWHPHNFGINQKENFDFLRQILEHYLLLNEKYNFSSISMSDMARKLLAEKIDE